MDEAAKLKEHLEDTARDLGLASVGFASTRPFARELERLERRREAGMDSRFEPRDLRSRVFPSALLEGAQTIISVALAYPTPHSLPWPHDGELRGRVSSHSWGMDYHRVLGDKLETLSGALEEAAPTLVGKPAKTSWYVDTGPLIDRAVAERAGLGFIGKNTCLITPKHGSWVFLGEVITNIWLPRDKPLKSDCGECDICLTACPTGALVQPYSLDATRCLAQVTQNRDLVDESIRTQLGGNLYGCDICQLVCPINKQAIDTYDPGFEPRLDEAYPKLLNLFELSNREFSSRFGHLAGAWRGLRTWQRNALLVIGNRRDERARDVLVSLLDSPRWEFRALSAWALAQLGQANVRGQLERRLECEREERVRGELHRALDKFETEEQRGGL